MRQAVGIFRPSISVEPVAVMAMSAVAICSVLPSLEIQLPEQ